METLEDYAYDLPPELIAQEPSLLRTASRLLVLDRSGAGVEHRGFEDLPSYLGPNDVLVMNNTKVIPARLEAQRASGGKVELFLLEPANRTPHGDRPPPSEGGASWIALAKPSSRLKVFEQLELCRGGRATLAEFRGGGEWLVRFDDVDGAPGLLERGRMPLPHYIQRERVTDSRDHLDRERYQTVYADVDGAVAAPTAGLHFTQELLATIAARQVQLAYLTLHVGVGTFAPVRAGDYRQHTMHEERYTMTPEAAHLINAARAAGGRIVAVGTTSARVLETVARDDGIVEAREGRTGIYIYPPYRFKAVDMLVTNFHLPRSTLLLLVSAFAERERMLETYRLAVENRYRFYSYGDAMLIL